MKKKKAKLSTMRRTQFTFYCILVVLFISVSGFFLAIFYSMPHDSFENNVYSILALITFVAVACGVLIGAIAFTYNRFIVKPIIQLSDAAKKVAEGDYSIKLAPIPKAEKIDELNVLFENFNTMVSELASTEILKNDFVSNVSHELKTPLSVIQNLSAMLQSDGLTDEERKEYAVKINEATKRLSSLVTNILQLSRLENQKIVANKKKYNLSEQLCRCIINYEQVWDSKNIEINTDFDQAVEIFSDESLFEIVWNNLISNAVKFTPENGRIDIAAKPENGHIVITVEDSGCGISEHDVKHIFDKFYQADTSHATKGNGLGLALVKEIVALLKAEISVESTLGKGTRFTVRIKID
ncbi:MAG: HAMP domain-containing histidine kinase [Clostridiales bacterium]|nr:HAMP domain-containing histidine kinase [Clostridiales bacterium]